jgi:hypothetical protein
MCTKIFHCKTLQNLPKSGFLVLRHAIWQPCFSPENFSRQLVDEDVLEAGQELRKADPSDGLGHRGQLGA